jgi:signal peptidase II
MVGKRLPYLALLIVALDQALKMCVERWLPLDARQPLAGGMLTLTHVQNTGVALGWLENAGAVVLAASLAAVIWLCYFWASAQARGAPGVGTFTAGLSCFLGGSAGNTLDRLRLGHVIDFIGLPNGLVINLADLTIALGALLVCCALWSAPRSMWREA